MEINLNGKGFGNVGLGLETMNANGAERVAQPKDFGAGRETKGAVTITNAPIGISSAEPVIDVPDSALSRDDALGKLVSAAFNLQPPPMPAFTD